MQGFDWEQHRVELDRIFFKDFSLVPRQVSTCTHIKSNISLAEGVRSILNSGLSSVVINSFNFGNRLKHAQKVWEYIDYGF